MAGITAAADTTWVSGIMVDTTAAVRIWAEGIMADIMSPIQDITAGATPIWAWVITVVWASCPRRSSTIQFTLTAGRIRAVVTRTNKLTTAWPLGSATSKRESTIWP